MTEVSVVTTGTLRHVQIVSTWLQSENGHCQRTNSRVKFWLKSSLRDDFYTCVIVNYSAVNSFLFFYNMDPCGQMQIDWLIDWLIDWWVMRVWTDVSKSASDLLSNSFTELMNVQVKLFTLPSSSHSSCHFLYTYCRYYINIFWWFFVTSRYNLV